jgi:hypothetical protein
MRLDDNFLGSEHIDPFIGHPKNVFLNLCKLYF